MREGRVRGAVPEKRLNARKPARCYQYVDNINTADLFTNTILKANNRRLGFF
jgi:hypothetical protein